MTREQRKRALRRDLRFMSLALAAGVGICFAVQAVIPSAETTAPAGPVWTEEELAYHQNRDKLSQKAMGDIREYTAADEAYIAETIRLEDERIEAALLEQGYFREDVPLDYVYQDILQTACQSQGIPYELALAVIERESGFDVDAVGPDGHDLGLFQIRASNHDWLRSETGADPMTAEGNIVCGVWFLAYLYDYCGGDWEAALTCWRWGPGNEEKTEYAAAVLEAAEDWRQTT